ncbi:hypothetical protein PG993_010037 [Apiospora rasikravindrae]|uniref:Uncharacterized protein n=1 Tax=Apiospora rasikravindrae TaxID=990691 RepID=A0ABR1SL40_9PEZI
MADIESQVQSDGKAFIKTTRPSYTRLCTCKVLPICLAICIISIFSAAIVCTNLGKPVPSNAVIAISVIAGCLLLLIFAGYLKIYHDRNGMGKVHPRAEQALKDFRDRLVRLFCCIDMNSYAPSANNKSNDEEAQKIPPKENSAGEGHAPPEIRVVAVSRQPQERESLQRPNNTVQGPRDQPRTPGDYPSRRRAAQQNPQQGQHHQSLQPPDPQQRMLSRQASRPSLHDRSAASSNYAEASQADELRLPSKQTTTDVNYTMPLHGNDSRNNPPAKKRLYRSSAGVAPLQTPHIRHGSSDQAYLVSVPDAAVQLQAVLGDTVTTPLKSFIKPTRSIRHEEDTENHQQRLFGSPSNSRTQGAIPSTSGATTDASTLASRPGSSMSSTATPTTWESADSWRVSAQCHTEQRIWRNNRDIMTKHRAQCHTMYPTGLAYCRPLRSGQGQWINDPERRSMKRDLI